MRVSWRKDQGLARVQHGSGDSITPFKTLRCGHAHDVNRRASVQPSSDNPPALRRSPHPLQRKGADSIASHDKTGGSRPDRLFRVRQDRFPSLAASRAWQIVCGVGIDPRQAVWQGQGHRGQPSPGLVRPRHLCTQTHLRWGGSNREGTLPKLHRLHAGLPMRSTPVAMNIRTCANLDDSIRRAGSGLRTEIITKSFGASLLGRGVFFWLGHWESHPVGKYRASR